MCIRDRYYVLEQDKVLYIKSGNNTLYINDKNTILTFMKMMKKYMPVYTFPCQCGTNQNSCCLAAEDKRIPADPPYPSSIDVLEDPPLSTVVQFWYEY